MKIRFLAFSLLCALLSAAVAAAADETRSNEELAERESALIDQLSKLNPADANHQDELRKIGDELRQIQEKLYPSNSFSFGGVPSSFSDAVPPADFSNEPTSSFSPFDGMDAATLRQVRADIVSQVKNLDRTLKVLGPGDEGLSASLREERQELSDRIQEIDAHLGASSDGLPVSQQGQAAVQTDPTRPAIPDSTPDSTRFDPVQPAQPESVSAGELPDAASFGAIPPSSETAGIEGTWYTSENKNQQILDAIAELQRGNEETRRQLDAVLDELKTIEAQLKLLSRQAVLENETGVSVPRK